MPIEFNNSELGSSSRLARAISQHLDKLPEHYSWEPSVVGNIKAATLILEKLTTEKIKTDMIIQG